MSVSKRPRSLSPTPASTKKPRTTTSTRFLILSDTHDLALPNNLPECDVLLHCGDLTEHGTPSSISAALTALGRIPAELRLVIAGNHEIYLDREYCTSQGGTTAEISAAQTLISSDPTSTASKNGITFLSEGTHTFTLSSGATFTMYTSPYTPAHGTSAFQYPSSEDRFNRPSSTPPWAKNVSTTTSRVPDTVDIIMTHGPAKYILDQTTDGTSAGCEHLRRAVARAKPRLFCFGHVHAGYGAQRLGFSGEKKEEEEGGDGILPFAREWVGRDQARRKGYARLAPGAVKELRRGGQTLAVNAAVEGEEKGVWGNAPWVVDLEL